MNDQGYNRPSVKHEIEDRRPNEKHLTDNDIAKIFVLQLSSQFSAWHFFDAKHEVTDFCQYFRCRG
jgi:hypothetical protein